jgi:hypothetical protein
MTFFEARKREKRIYLGEYLTLETLDDPENGYRKTGRTQETQGITQEKTSHRMHPSQLIQQ